MVQETPDGVDLRRCRCLPGAKRIEADYHDGIDARERIVQGCDRAIIADAI
jgi:hypothetical protein